MRRDRIRRLDFSRRHRDVHQPALHAPREAGLGQQPLRLALVRSGELEVHPAPGASPQQLDLDLADAAAHLEHGRALDPPRLEVRHDPLRRFVEPALAIALRHPPRDALAEEAVAAPRITTARHVALTSSRMGPSRLQRAKAVAG